ncbi:TonB-dependent receptor plug domain-containing protein [Acinetobacter boissieri]|uniref:Outer membrane receptor proteins, mostly Fe transport n=1 Tax=Acinetobacter boissieri TaxID=1219383 RepID=A0A1G6JDT8_9GAMM|nr:TonB-dependent receptor plug domain-containing protein [Acinetobacter boissieri]SDC16992.1 Outer membrane receptor proteins, mostly Fe transport [Acinetobacter boissieri]
MNRRIYTFFVFCALVNAAYAEEKLNTAEEDTIVVRSTPTSQSMGTQIITAAQIAKMPTRNGSVTELLKNNPNVQFSNQADNGNTPGELQPENVSFHGEKFYQNSYLIDGLSNNNTINPGANNGELTTTPDGYSPTDLPAGGTQSFWINSELIASAEVFDSNISAKYGGFTGGVVDAKLKDPDLNKPSGRISFRTTNDHLTEYHVDDRISEAFEQASNLYYQPKFNKKFYTATINQPLSDQAGLIFSYNRQESDIPFYHSGLGKWEDQNRSSETYLLKGSYLLTNGDTLRATAMYSPHESTYIKKDIQDGAFTNTGGGYRFNFEWEHLAHWGKVNSLIGYQFEENDIQHAADYYARWYSRYLNTASKAINWNSTEVSKVGTAFGEYGGYGHFATKKGSLTAKQDYQLNPMQWGQIQHQIDLGLDVNNYSARYQRFNDVVVSRGTPTWSTATVCQSGDVLCIDGEQYFKSRTLYPARVVKGNYTNYAGYLQDSMLWKNLEVTAGVRLSYDDYLSNLNISPRLSGSLDVFGDHTTRLFAGANRYHAQSLLAYKLRQGISEYYVQTRTSASSAWTTGSLTKASYDYDISNLKTPYSDELNLGIAQRIADTIWTLKYVNRQGRDQFGRGSTTASDGQKYYYLTNDGKTKGNTVSLTIEPISPYQFKYVDLTWNFAANYSNNKSSSQTYYDVSNTDENMVVFDNKLMQRGDMDALNYNTPWNAFFNIDMTVPRWNFNWTQRLGYTSGYKSYSTSTLSCDGTGGVCGSYVGNATLYTPVKYKNYVSYDWRFSYTKPMFKNQSLELTLDVMNVFNTAIESYKSTTLNSAITYKTGRQIWLGAAWNW